MFSHEGYRALREGAGVVRRTDRGVLAVTGGDRIAWLQGLLTNDVPAIPEGQAGYGAYLTPQGRMIADMRVAPQADRVLLDVPEPLAAELRDRLDGLIFAEDVALTVLSPATVVVDVHGPAAASVVERARFGAPASLAVARLDELGVPGFALFVARAEADALVANLGRAGASEVPLESLEVVRIERGVPRFLADMTDETIPLEAGIEDRAISFTKGCYVGQEVIVRVLHRGGGRVARKLVGLAFEGEQAAQPGDRIAGGDRDIGRVTSAAWSPALERTVALGYVHRDFLEPGTAVEVLSGDRRVPATVSALPFAR